MSRTMAWRPTIKLKKTVDGLDSGEESLSEVEGDEDHDLSKREAPLSDEEIQKSQSWGLCLH